MLHVILKSRNATHSPKKIMSCHSCPPPGVLQRKPSSWNINPAHTDLAKMHIEGIPPAPQSKTQGSTICIAGEEQRFPGHGSTVHGVPQTRHFEPTLCSSRSFDCRQAGVAPREICSPSSSWISRNSKFVLSFYLAIVLCAVCSGRRERGGGGEAKLATWKERHTWPSSSSTVRLRHRALSRRRELGAPLLSCACNLSFPFQSGRTPPRWRLFVTSKARIEEELDRGR